MKLTWTMNKSLLAVVPAAMLAFAGQAQAQTGACCTGGVCSSSTLDLCTVGLFQPGGTCDPNPCGIAGVCCRGATCNSAITGATCQQPAGGAGARYSASPACNNSGNTQSPCCYADYNKQSSVNVQDIFDYLNDWFAGSPYAKVGGDGTQNNLNVQDIFNFLDAWFQGCPS